MSESNPPSTGILPVEGGFIIMPFRVREVFYYAITTAAVPHHRQIAYLAYNVKALTRLFTPQIK